MLMQERQRLFFSLAWTGEQTRRLHEQVMDSLVGNAVDENRRAGVDFGGLCRD